MSEPRTPLLLRIPESVGASLRGAFETLAAGVTYVGGFFRLIGNVADRSVRGIVRPGPRVKLEAIASQAFRFGVRSIPIVMLVQLFIGMILALNLAPVLDSYGQIERMADVVGIAVFRELGPLLTAILLSGYAGASIAAELGTMVEGEELKALRAHALDPIRFLVAPRVIATAIMMILLTVLADLVGVLGGFITSVFVLDVSPQVYIDLTQAAVKVSDYWTGLSKAFVFGMIIATLACYEGLSVQGGAEGVGRATTTTVVKSIVALIAADSVFAIIFYVVGW
ncbi:MAG: MlaE family ABC transporter permease [Phycisphaerae bacterium]